MGTVPITKTIRVAIQGGLGAFHEMAARTYFTGIPIQLVPCLTFEDVFYSIGAGNADCAIVAIENSIAGSILPNYTLLQQSGFKISGEIYLRVIQNLMALPGESMEGLREIHSHPVAIQQCNLFLENFRRRGVRIVGTADTALSAKQISRDQLKGIGALASKLAASIYKLDILAESVEADKKNYTRFLYISPGNSGTDIIPSKTGSIDKSSLCFSLPHKAGSLSQILSVLAFYNINLTKIQSLPIAGKTWEYFFHADLVFDDYHRYCSAISAITPLINQLEVLGEYRQAEMPVETGEEQLIRTHS
jgi:prephenate dehydratase